MLEKSEELRFWTGIMRDHGEFILTSLVYNEQEALYNAGFFRDTFATLHEKSKTIAGSGDPIALGNLVNECLAVLTSFIQWKKVLLARHLQCKLGTSLPPTFYNHMINEAMEFYRILCEIRCNAVPNPIQELMELHRVWLTDAAGHAATIADDLDPVEKPLIKEAQEFEACFQCLADKAEELCKMLVRTCLSNGALSYLNEQAIRKMEEFIRFLEKLLELTLGCKVLGILKPLVPNHMLREEKYYLARLSAVVKTV